MLLVMVTLHTFSWEKSFTLGKLTRVNKRPHRWSQHLGLPYKNLNFIRVMEVLAGKQTETALCSKAKPIKEKFSSYQFPATSQVRAVFVQIFPFLSWKQHHPPERVVWVLWSFFVRLLYFRQHALLAKLVFQSDYNLASVINAFADEGPFFLLCCQGKKIPWGNFGHIREIVNKSTFPWAKVCGVTTAIDAKILTKGYFCPRERKRNERKWTGPVTSRENFFSKRMRFCSCCCFFETKAFQETEKNEALVD